MGWAQKGRQAGWKSAQREGLGVEEWGSARGEGTQRRGEHQREQGFGEIGGLGEGDSPSERLGQRELEGQKEDGFQMGEGADSDQGGEGSDRGSWGQRKGQFGEQCVHMVCPLQPGEGGAVPVEVAPEQRPGSSLGPASPSQLTDPELIIINEQLGRFPGVCLGSDTQHISPSQR